MRSTRLYVAIILLVFISPLNSIIQITKAAPDAANWQNIGQAGGPTQGIAIQGSYAYLGVGPRLAVIDISDPANPHASGYTAPFPNLVQGVAVSGTHAYVAAGPAGLRVVDISSPTNPFEVGAWDSPGFAENVAVTGSTAYLADGPYGLRVVNVSNAAAPAQIASAFDMNYTYDVAVAGRYAYVAAGGAGLLLADISNPAYPVELGDYDTPGNACSVAVLNGWAYVADERAGLQIINVADPLHPTLLNNLQTYGWAFDVTVSGSTAYLAAAFGGLRVVNVLDPAHPLEMGSLSWAQSNATGLAIAGSRIYLVDCKKGLRLINGIDPVHPAQTSLFNLFQFARMVVTGGGYAYVAAGFNGVRIFNLSDPAHPVEVAFYQADGLFYSLKLAGNRLYAGTMIESSQGGIHVLDISDPAHPVKIGYYADIAECWGIDSAGTTLYVADAGGIKVLDFSDLSNPILLGFTPIVPRGLTVVAGLAYVTVEFNGVRIFDVSDPTHISQIGAFYSASSFSHGPIPVAGGYAYVSDSTGLRILNVSNPANPTEVSFSPTSGETDWVELSGDRAYVSEGSHGFTVFDVSQPATPQRVSGSGVLGSVQTLTFSDDNLYLAASEGGLQVFTPAAGTAASAPAVKQLYSPAVVHQFAPAHSVLAVPTTGLDAIRPATICTVTSTADSGPGTLRECLRNQVRGDVITFSPAVFPPSHPATILIGKERLPWLTQGNITLDASNSGVILDGSNVVGEWDPGIGVLSDGNTVRGLQIYHFPGSGITLIGSDNIIGGSRLLGSGPTGQGNVLSTNAKYGIQIENSPQNNLVTGNIIGLDSSGNVAQGNAGIGIALWGSQNNVIGSLEPGKNNIISANGSDGIQLYGYTTNGNQIVGNYVGTDITGTLDRGNAGVGVYVNGGSFDTLVQGNLISANHVTGVYVWDYASDFNVIIGNHIGLTLDGAHSLPNGGFGIGIGYAAYARIGGTTPGEGNLIGTGDLLVDGTFGADTLVQGNQVGLNATGTAVLPSAGNVLLTGSSRTIVGGATLAEANFITTTDGNFSLEARSAHNTIAGNFFGLAVDGLTPLATAGFQISILRSGNFIQGNHIANATSAGIWVDGVEAITIRRNSIYANPFKGIYLVNGANNNLPVPSLALSLVGGSGTACPGCTVELFLDAGNQGRSYLFSLVADGAGSFQFPKSCPLPYSNLTGTATDSQGNTSEFSAPQVALWDCASPNPLPALVSVNPTSVKELGQTTLLLLTGSSFFPGSVAQFNGATLITRYVNSSHLEAVLPVGQIRITGNTSITVFNPAPGGGTSNSFTFTILPLPKIYLPVLRK